MKKSSKSRVSRRVHEKMSFSELLEEYPEAADELFASGMHCVGCPVARFETIEQGASMHGIDTEQLIKKINMKINKRAKLKSRKSKKSKSNKKSKTKTNKKKR